MIVCNDKYKAKRSLEKENSKKLLTTGSGASSCLHITHGTPVFRPTAI